MQKVTFQHFIGYKASYVISYNTNIVSGTGVTADARNHYATGYINTDGFNRVFIDGYASENGSFRLFEYTADNTYIKDTTYEAPFGQSTIALSANTKSVRVCFDDTLSRGDIVKDGWRTIGVLRTCNPHYSKVNKKYTKEQNQMFFRQSLDGKLNLFGYDYEFVFNSSLEKTILFIMERFEGTSAKIFYKGSCNKADCAFDFTKAKCELKLTALDEYNKVLGGYENTYDLLALAPAQTKVYSTIRPLIQIYTLGSNTITNIANGTYWEEDVLEIKDPAFEDMAELYDNNFIFFNEFYEFTISNVNAELNGLYVGDSQTNRYINTKTGAYLFIDAELKKDGYFCLANSSGTVLYKSTKKIWHYYWITSEDEIDFTNFKMSEVGGSSSFYFTYAFNYKSFIRVLSNAYSFIYNNELCTTKALAANDFANPPANYKRAVGLITGSMLCSAVTTSTPTKFGQSDEKGQYFTDSFIGMRTGRVIPIARGSWANISVWYMYNEAEYKILQFELSSVNILRDNFFIADVISALLYELDPTLTHEANISYSKFLYGASDPTGVSSQKFFLFLTQKTNVLKGNYDQAAQKAETTFKTIMDMLRDCYKCYWFIDNGKLRIEHISYFLNGFSYGTSALPQLDFSSITDQFNKVPVKYFQGDVSYNRDDLPSRYEFSWPDSYTELFGPVNIDVLNNYVKADNTEEISPNDMASDIDYMIAKPDDFSSDGFCLIAAIAASGMAVDYKIPIVDITLRDTGSQSLFPTYTASIQNYYASWLFMAKYYMFDLSGDNITEEQISFEVKKVKKCLEYTIEFNAKLDLDDKLLINTTLGLGYVDEITLTANSNHAKIKLLYEPI